MSAGFYKYESDAVAYGPNYVLYKDFELLTIQAAVHGEEDSALRALITNPIGPDISQARELWADLRKENAGMIGALNG